MKIGGITEQELSDFWTPGNVETVLVKSWQAILACPLTSRDLPATVRSTMPETLRDPWEDKPENRIRKLQPNHQELTEAINAVHWIMFVDDERNRKVLAARLCGIKWKRIECFDGRSREYLRRTILRKCYRIIADHLNAEKKVITRGFTKVTKFGR